MNTYMKWVEYSLSNVKPGESVTVTAINGNSGLSKHLVNMGLVPGNTIKVISGSKNFPFIIDFSGTKIGITWDIACKIMVKKI